MRKIPDKDEVHWEKPDGVDIQKAVLEPNWPYIHTDVMGLYRGERVVFGVPMNREEGMAYYHINDDGSKKLDRPKIPDMPFTSSEIPECPFHPESDVVLTKHFDFRKDRFQFKCETCFLTRYIDL